MLEIAFLRCVRACGGGDCGGVERLWIGGVALGVAMGVLTPGPAFAQPVRADSAGGGAPRLLGLTYEVPHDSLATPPLRHLSPDHPRPGRLVAVGAGLATASVALHLWQKNVWWADIHRTSFHFHEG